MPPDGRLRPPELQLEIATTTATDVVLDALEQAIWTPSTRTGPSSAPAYRTTTMEYLSAAHTQHLPDAGIRPSLGAVGALGSSYDALTDSIKGLFKTEVIHPRGPWRTVDAVESATAE